MASLQDFGIRPLRAGGSFHTGQHKAICPKCADRPGAKVDPSLSVKINPDGFAVWNCHYAACGWTGNTGKKQFKVVKPTAAPVPMTPEHALSRFMKTRALSEETLEAFKIELCEKKFREEDGSFTALPAIMFPYLGEDGSQIHAIKYRSENKKFCSEVGGDHLLFGMHLCQPGEQLIITEGEFDTMAGYEAGLRNIVSVPNSSTGTMEWIQNCQGFLAGYKSFLLAVDNDKVGKELREALASRLGPENCSRPDWPEGVKDFNEALQRSGKEFVLSLAADAKPFPVNGIFDAADFFSQLDDILEHGEMKGASTGIHSLDEWFTIRPAEFTIVTAYPNAGKSEFVDQIMVNTAELHGWKWGIASFENNPPEHIMKLIEKNQLGSLYRKPRMSELSYQRGKVWVDEHFKFVVKDLDDGSPTLEWVLDKLTVAHRQYGLQAATIDPWNCLDADRGNMSETDHVAVCLRKLRQFVRKTNMHIFLVCHPKAQMRLKDGSFPVPTLHDVSGSKNFFAMADNGLSIARIQDEDAMDVYIRKVRSRAAGKAGGVVKLLWNPQCGKLYQDYTTEDLGEKTSGVI